MCTADRHHLLYELGTPADAQHALEEHLLAGSHHEAVQAFELLQKVCRSRTDCRWRMRRATRRVLRQATASGDPKNVEKALGCLAVLIPNELLPSILLSFNKSALQAT